MASRENQGLQIALIIFVMLTIVLIVTTYMFFSNYQAEKEKTKKLEADNTRLSTETKQAQTETGAIRALIDVKLGEKLDAFQAAHKKDLETHGKGFTEAEQNYRYLVEYLAKQLANVNERIITVTAHEKEMEEKIKVDEAMKIAEIQKYTEQIAATAAELESQRAKFNTDRTQITKSKDSLAEGFAAKRKDFDETIKKANAEVADLKSEAADLKKKLELRTEKERIDMKATEMSDGRITWINQRTRTVWINVGSADGLRRQTSFSVFPRDNSNPVEADRKGKIEVIRLMDRHLAEARIVDDDLSNPIMPGDQIFSPTWEPGRSEHFAMAGFIDIDKDGASDRQRVRNLITQNGGVIDAEVGDDNKRTGQMSINTKYLVLGDEPQGEGKTSAYAEMTGEAKLLGVKTINVADFLNYLGYKPEDRTVNLGKGAKANDFKPRLPEGVQRTMPGNTRPQDSRKPKAPVNKN